jgi:hypothetical protein
VLLTARGRAALSTELLSTEWLSPVS